MKKTASYAVAPHPGQGTESLKRTWPSHSWSERRLDGPQTTAVIRCGVCGTEVFVRREGVRPEEAQVLTCAERIAADVMEA
jgi:hypothetical protein